MTTVFALVRIPIILVAFGAAWRFHRRRNLPPTPLSALLPPLAGLLIASAGELFADRLRACLALGAVHWLWTAFLLRRGRFAWPAAGLLALLLVPFLAAVVLPTVNTTLEIAFVWYGFSATFSFAAAVGARKSPGGGFCVAGLAALMGAAVGIGRKLAGISCAGAAVAPLHAAALGLLLVALIRGIPASPPLPELAPPSIRRHRNARIMAWTGALLPLFFLAAMVLCNGRYCWYNQYISESGLVFVRKLPNRPAAWLLTAGLTGAAILCGWYFVECFRWSRASRRQRAVILGFGMLGAVGLAGIGVVPFDQHPAFHLFCTRCSIPLGIAILFAALTPGDLFGRRSEKAIWLVFAAFVLAVVGALTFLEQHRLLPHRPTGPVIQKTTVLAFYIYMMGQVLAYLRSTRLPRDAADDQAGAQMQ